MEEVRQEALTWREVLHGEKQKRYFSDIIEFI